MFNDKRSKNILFLSHCIINQNSITNEGAAFPGSDKDVLQLLIDSNIGIVQMPCPELCCLGLDRKKIDGIKDGVLVENTRIRKLLQVNSSSTIIENLVNQITLQIKEYTKHEFNVLGVVGINRSPTCGISTTTKDGSEVDGEGVFIEKLKVSLKNARIDIPFVGIKLREQEKKINSIKMLISRK